MREASFVDPDIPQVESPYAGRRLGLGTHLAISAYWFATNFMWGALITIMLPAEIERMAPFYQALAIALLTGLSALVALVVPLVAGALSDRCAAAWGRRRPFMVFGIAINVVGLVLMAATFALARPIPVPADGRDPGLGGTLAALFTSPSYMGFLLAYMVVQFGNNVTSAAYSGIIPDLVPEDQRGTASGYMALMSQLGSLFGAVGCGLLLGGAKEPVKYALLSAVLVGVGAWTILGIRETALPSRPPRIDWAKYVRSLWIDPRRYPNFAWVWITRALVMLGYYAVLPFVRNYLRDVVGSSDPGGDASKIFAVVLVASVISAVYGGRISDRIGRKKVVYVANAVIAFMALGFIFCRSIVEVVGVGLLFGLGFGAYTSVDWALGTDVLPSKEDAAKGMAVWHISMTLPQTLAAPVAGLLIERWKSVVVEKGEHVVHYSPEGYTLVFILCAVCFAMGAYLLKNVKGVR